MERASFVLSKKQGSHRPAGLEKLVARRTPSGSNNLAKRLYKQNSRGNAANNSSSIYDRVTSQILSALASGVIPWRKPWKGREFLPCNAVSKRTYNGVNLLLLGLAPFSDHRWMTVRQANELGGHVRKGEHGAIVVFWKIIERDGDESEPKRTMPLLRHHYVFNAEQIEGFSLEDVPPATTLDRIEEAEEVVRRMPNPPRLIEHSSGAFYRPADDTVAMPRIERFVSADHYYCTLMHELGHATGHPDRLNRPGVAGARQFGWEDYSREELVAELASAFVCAEIGLDNSLVSNAASYIDGWLDALNRDPRAIVQASSHARRATDYILGMSSSR